MSSAPSTDFSFKQSEALVVWSPPSCSLDSIRNHYFTYYRTRPESYAAKLREHERFIRSLAVTIFQTELTFDPDAFCLATTGSDARYEKMNTRFSPLELILITRQRDAATEELHSQVTAIAKSNTLFSKNVELQTLTHPEQFGFFCSTYFPTRALEAQWIHGNFDLFRSYKEQFVDLLPKIHPQATTSLTFDKKTLQDALNQVLLVQKGTSKHVELATGSILIDNGRRKGTKYSHLRAIQYSLDCCTLRALVTGRMNVESLERMPLPIVERMSWLHSEHLLPWIDSAGLSAIQDAYHTAMLCHQIAQRELESYELSGQSINEGPLSLKLAGKEDLEFMTEAMLHYITGFKTHYSPAAASSKTCK